jgi:hypothetical protein
MKLTFSLFCFIVAAVAFANLISWGMLLTAAMMLTQLVEAAK